MTKRTVVVTLILLTFASAVGLLTTTRFGVFLVFDVLGDIGDEEVDTATAAAPIELDRTLTSHATFPLPIAIEQASGIEYFANREAFVLNTDQAELFELNSDLTTIESSELLIDGPLLFRQGQVEGIAADGDDLLIAGEWGRIERWSRVDGMWRENAVIELPDSLANLEFSSIAFDENEKEIFLASDERFEIYVLDETLNVARTLKPSANAREGRDVNEYQISGLEYERGTLFAVTENYATLLLIDPASGQVKEAIGLSDAGEASDLTVLDKNVYVTVDHNLFDERPGVRVYDLNAA